MSLDYYGILGVDRSASSRDIQKAFYSLSKVFHPDKFDKNMSQEDRVYKTEKYKLMTIAYTVLYSPQARAKYDKGLINDTQLPDDDGYFDYCDIFETDNSYSDTSSNCDFGFYQNVHGSPMERHKAEYFYCLFMASRYDKSLLNTILVDTQPKDLNKACCTAMKQFLRDKKHVLELQRRLKAEVESAIRELKVSKSKSRRSPSKSPRKTKLSDDLNSVRKGILDQTSRCLSDQNESESDRDTRTAAPNSPSINNIENFEIKERNIPRKKNIKYSTKYTQTSLSLVNISGELSAMLNALTTIEKDTIPDFSTKKESCKTHSILRPSVSNPYLQDTGPGIPPLKVTVDVDGIPCDVDLSIGANEVVISDTEQEFSGKKRKRVKKIKKSKEKTQGNDTEKEDAAAVHTRKQNPKRKEKKLPSIKKPNRDTHSKTHNTKDTQNGSKLIKCAGKTIHVSKNLKFNGSLKIIKHFVGEKDMQNENTLAEPEMAHLREYTPKISNKHKNSFFYWVYHAGLSISNQDQSEVTDTYIYLSNGEHYCALKTPLHNHADKFSRKAKRDVELHIQPALYTFICAHCNNKSGTATNMLKHLKGHLKDF